MKRNRILLILALIICVITFNNCDDEPAKTDEELYLERLSLTWKVAKVTLDDEDVTDFYTNMALTIRGDKTYSVANGVEGVWPNAGIFTMGKIAGDHYQLTREEDGVIITITALTETELKYTFQYTASGGRTKSVSGVYEFEMKR